MSKHIIVNMLELLNALDNSSIGNDAKIIRFMVFKTKQSGISRGNLSTKFGLNTGQIV